MKIAILGAGFTGLTAALKLLQLGHQVTVLEKENSVGGLAGGFKRPNWDWTLEKAYHHWFTNDDSVLNLANKINHQVIIQRPLTSVYVRNHFSTLDSPLTLLTFPYLPLIDRLRVGLATMYLKLINNHHPLEGKLALPWIRKYMGEASSNLIWEPLFQGKFSSYAESVALTWFWARIKKRTTKLAYPEGGFLYFAEKIAKEIQSLGGDILLNTTVNNIHQSEKKLELNCTINKGGTSKTVSLLKQDSSKNKSLIFDKVLSTLPSPILTKITPQLPKSYSQGINSIDHLWAQNLILILKEPFLKNVYWLNITNKDFPFLVLAEHTNFMDPKHYGGEHILYIGNYLPPDHPYLKLTAKELMKVFDLYLKKINPTYQSSLIDYQLFQSPYAQPIVDLDYSKKIPSLPKGQPNFQTPLPNLYIANLDMVYPWDRGTNYAVEMGEKVAEKIILE